MNNTYAQRFKSAAERFWEKVDKTPGQGPQGDCWIWIGSRFKHSDPRFRYGQFWLEGRNRLAHRVSYEMANGTTLDSDVQLCHRCDNPPCVNPSHVFEGSAQANAVDRTLKGRGNPPIGERARQHKLTEEEVREIRGLRQMGYTHESIAKQYGVSRSAVRLILIGRNWKHIS